MLEKELKRSIIQSLTGKYSVYVIQIVSLSILSRLFTPAEFGIVASAQVFLAFFQLLATSGLAPAIVYEKSLSIEQRDGIFSFTLIFGSLLSLLFFLVAPSLHDWLNLRDSYVVFYSLSICVLFSSLSMLPLATLQKDSSFLTIARAELFAEVISLIACYLAFLYWNNINALVIKLSLIPVFRFVFYYLSSKKTTIGQPAFGIRISSVKVLFDFAKYQIGFNVLNYFSRNLDSILIAKYFGTAALGVYDKTYQVMRYPLQLFTFSITPALQPVLTKYKDDKKTVCLEYYRVAIKLAVVGLFSGTVIFWCAEDIIFILFGDQWFDSVLLLKVLALSIPLQMVMSSTGGVYQAFGATETLFVCGVFSSIINVSAIILGVYYNNLLYLCFFLCIAFSINYIQCFVALHYSVFRGVGYRYAFMLGGLVVIIFINYFFFSKEFDKPNSIILSIVDIGWVSSCAALVCISIYFVFNKFLKHHEKLYTPNAI